MADGSPEIVVSHDEREVARSAARRLVEAVLRTQREGRVPSLVLTGGTLADLVHRAVLDAPGEGDVDWSRVEVWFGDERFVPAGDPDRNALHAHEALLSHVTVDPARVHEMPASDGPFGDVEAAAAAYAEEVTQALRDGPFDVLMLGIGPDGHCASLFPGHPALLATGAAVAVRDSPKPPPTRISLSLDTLRKADEVWFIASGSGKAQAVRDALRGGDVPASGPRGGQRTVWLLDEEAAALL